MGPMEWLSKFSSTQQDWEAVVKKELKTEDLARFLSRPLAEGGTRATLATQGQHWFDPSFRRAALSLTWTREADVKWSELPKLVATGVWDFILDPFLLGWDDARLKQELTHAGEALQNCEARLWVCHDSLPLPQKAFRVIGANEVVARGGHSAHELGLLLTHLIEWAQSHSGESVAVGVTLDSEFFKSIAKKRALKAITEAAFREMGCVELLSRITWMARGNWREFTALDCSNNILRNATSVAAGYIAGAGVVESLPFDLIADLPLLERDRAQRLALTTQLVLQNESALGEVSDPASGGHTLEELTRTLGEEAWKIMQRLMALSATERETHLGVEIDKRWEDVQKRFATRRLVQTGVNDFPEASELVKLQARWMKNDHVRLARGFEELRLSLTKKPIVSIAVVGDYAALQARFNFTKNYFELLGLQVIDSGPGLNLEQATAWLKTQIAPVTAWVSTDEDHARLTTVGERCYVAGKTPVQGCLNLFAGQDVLATLEALVLWWKGRA